MRHFRVTPKTLLKSTMTEKVLSQLQKEYRDFFLGKLKEYEVKSPVELTKDRKSEFFISIKQDWAKIKIDKKQHKDTTSKDPKSPTKSLIENIAAQTTKKSEENKRLHTETQTIQDFSVQIIKSEPNEKQTLGLRILYNPNNHFSQEKNYNYPVVKMPVANSLLKLPRVGRTNQKGYKEKDFFNQIKLQIANIEFSDNVHMVIPNFNRPYEPDIVLFDKKHNLYIDIEIDEPYDGYFRYPTHCIKLEEEQKQDDIRDLFFTESGWIVIRFTEKQVHLQSNECIDYIKNVINSVSNRNFNTSVKCEIENQWDGNQCIQWQKINYREKYLGIDRFRKQSNTKEIKIEIEEEDIEKVIQRTKKFNFESWSTSIAFDEESHKYIHPKDETGNAEYISVTTLIERFFPFDLKRYIEKKAVDENRTEEDVLIEYLMIRDEASEKGTFLHNQIENYLKGIAFDNGTEEFKYFLKFYEDEIIKRNLVFSDAEKMIHSNKYNVAGTIDCLFKKSDKDEFVMLDWKRSKKLIIDGCPRKFGYGYALSELNHLDNSSYYRYCLQQNIYKVIAEKEFSINISSMKLVILHENYQEYYVVNVPEMNKEATTILNSLKHKI